ncbi:hypothetical protein BKA81DRAFT_374700 [Phyllosticta paracitricarpa]
MAKRPNFLVILADDVGFSDVGCYDLCYKSPRSPQTLPQNVDRGAVLKGEELPSSGTSYDFWNKARRERTPQPPPFPAEEHMDQDAQSSCTGKGDESGKDRVSILHERDLSAGFRGSRVGWCQTNCLLP